MADLLRSPEALNALTTQRGVSVNRRNALRSLQHQLATLTHLLQREPDGD